MKSVKVLIVSVLLSVFLASAFADPFTDEMRGRATKSATDFLIGGSDRVEQPRRGGGSTKVLTEDPHFKNK